MSHNQSTNDQHNVDTEEFINIKVIINRLLSGWYWLAIFVCFGLISSYIYLHYTSPSYQISAKLLVNDDEKGGSIGKQASALMDLGGLMTGKNSVENEVEILRTRFLMEQVVRDMQLNIVYSKKNGLMTQELYKSPIKLTILKGIDSIQSTEIEVKKISNSKISVKTEASEREVEWGQAFSIENVGVVSLLPTEIKFIDGKVLIDIYSIDDRVATMMKQLSVGVANKQVSIVDLGLAYSLPNKGEDILNKLIYQYIVTNLRDKNSIADSTGKFIKQRINAIASELGDVENDVESFKEKNKLADMSEQGKALVQSTSGLTSELAKAESQVTILNDLESYMKDSGKNKRVFPASLLPQDMVFSGLMNQYNALLIEREKQLLSVTEESPFIKNIDEQISQMRAGILANIQSTKNSFVVSRDKLRNQLEQAQGQIGGVPQIEKNYLKLARNRDIKQELYIFLMQKAEETAISKTSNISVAKLIDPPKADNRPISPKKNVVYLLGLIVGLIIPSLVLIIGDMLKTTISTKEDITNSTSVPVIGEISHNSENDNLIVANQERSAISEQFRALRTNLSFYLKNADEKIILLTSSMSGEGKSFTAINLGNILALAGKKVLLMELDLRKPGLSAKLGVSNDIGFSNYTIDSKVRIEDIIKPLAVNKNMFIISSGPLPPNPAETLISERTPELISELKDQFDYIIMDAPPVGIITDAQLLAVYADLTIYVIRQKITKKDQLKIVEELYRTNKMKNLGIVVNDIITKIYGYGYGYGNYGEEINDNFLSKISKYLKFSKK
ncbi:capsular exopolysaccharide synthesis family protein [Pedobacter psychrotolerans]|uniref:non-specific protein-tyrosine kinase n=1 Tax=Pedobacter psychrotolerans TaxID=1843235 RepID=A0A4R2HF81_9SPHI|nr:tyrosine-protein kinase [Pedobacter psychrotolerans]TCO26695.1 capsular exopolysaccharide synthesis family protein [Pedobacter psychrotolerans]GGE55790.1 tyrosine protein kinase [Pedobacter psychrotolerans]